MVNSEAQRFGDLLTAAIYQVRLRERKLIQVIQDELGYALGRGGGSAIEYWRKGHLPPRAADVALLARELVRRGGLEEHTLPGFLASAAYAPADALIEELFPHGRARSPAQPAPVPLAPFVIGPPILHPRQFFGRAYELRRIFALWSQAPLQHIAVVGPRRSGKTSLLHYLRRITLAGPHDLRPDQRADWLPNPGAYRWALIDFQDLRLQRRERLLRSLLLQLALPVPGRAT